MKKKATFLLLSMNHVCIRCKRMNQFEHEITITSGNRTYEMARSSCVTACHKNNWINVISIMKWWYLIIDGVSRNLLWIICYLFYLFMKYIFMYIYLLNIRTSFDILLEKFDSKYSFCILDISYNAFLRELIMEILWNWFALFDQGHEQYR